MDSLTKDLKKYIKENWNTCVRENKIGTETLIGMPYPYIIPAPKYYWEEMYYWDTYFTSQGLYLTGEEALAKSCTENMLYLVDRYGYMPNGNRTYYLNRSQPPFLSMMVMDVYKRYRDKEFLERAYETLKKEYNFWMTQRITPIGLNKFSVNKENLGDTEHISKYFSKRIGYTIPNCDSKTMAVKLLTDCESGWDFNPRCEFKQDETVHIDLNCNLYLYEKNFAFMSRELNLKEEDKWEKRADARKELMNRYLWDGSAFMDYNFNEDKTMKLFSAASFFALWAGVASLQQAEETRRQLKRIEREYGIAATEEYSLPGIYQWAYPNGWPPLQYVVIKGLDNYGFKEDARRVAQKYVSIMETLFEKTGTLWEKYNVLTGNKDAVGDYGERIMLGWSAGVYLFAKDYLES
mgnify:FL=1